jgi:Leucine-rich repeat (LRR) protein
VLKLESNEIVRIEGMEGLVSLEQLFLGDNHISRFEGLANNQKLHIININNQKTKQDMRFDEETCSALAYCLETFHCDGNRVRDITSKADNN